MQARRDMPVEIITDRLPKPIKDIAIPVLIQDAVKHTTTGRIAWAHKSSQT